MLLHEPGEKVGRARVTVFARAILEVLPQALDDGLMVGKKA